MNLIIIKNMCLNFVIDGSLTIDYLQMIVNMHHNYIDDKLGNDFLNSIR